jgi:hypothetical protein
MGSTPHGSISNDRPSAERIIGTGTVHFIRKTEVPDKRKVTYANSICNIRPQ